jgi:hypothetical protein
MQQELFANEFVFGGERSHFDSFQEGQRDTQIVLEQLSACIFRAFQKTEAKSSSEM